MPWGVVCVFVNLSSSHRGRCCVGVVQLGPAWSVVALRNTVDTVPFRVPASPPRARRPSPVARHSSLVARHSSPVACSPYVTVRSLVSLPTPHAWHARHMVWRAPSGDTHVRKDGGDCPTPVYYSTYSYTPRPSSPTHPTPLQASGSGLRAPGSHESVQIWYQYYGKVRGKVRGPFH